jgi:hypothetical protein
MSDDGQLRAVPYYHDIREAFGQPGCPFCRLLAKNTDRYLDTILWEMVLDLEVRVELNEARGYCAEHGWRLVRIGSVLGVAILMGGVLKTLLDVLASHPVESSPEFVLTWMRKLGRDPASRATASLVDALKPETRCPACTYVEALEKDYSDTLVAHLEEPGALAGIYGESDGLCLAHFGQTLSRARPAEARILVDVQRAVWQRLHAELGEFIRKSDHRYKDEEFGAEKDSWRRALEAISGPEPRGGRL